ncbi:MAG: glycine cleavage system aminomethyltransferase GcvT [Myxococcales bacterium]|nr:glycine cleavage system aminomethyltransferase GcvT [Myxococcales bacterium]
MSAAPEAPLAVTPIHAEHVALGARMVPFAGWHMPVQYRGLAEEHRAVRTAAGLFDVSHMGELELEGAAATGLVDELVTQNARKVEVGQAVYTVACNEAGTILDDLICYRRGAEKWLVVCNASNRPKIAAHFAAAAAPLVAQGELRYEDASDRTALLALQGPRGLEIAGKLGGDGPALADLRPFRLRDATLAGVACVAARTGYTGEDGLELFCRNEDAVALWRAVVAAGRPLGLEPAGLGARDTLRLEARLCLYGNDIDETTNPLEAGLAWVVKLDKPSFRGKAALERVRAAGVARKLVGFEMRGRGIARHGYPLCGTSGQPIGTCTSGSPSPTLGKSIGLGYVPAAAAAIGTELRVDCRGKLVEAVVVPTPFYKRPQR